MFESVDEIDVNWLKENFQLIHYFGLGFIQLKINDEHRLHFYNKELPPIVDEEDIHNHRYNFTSRILKGTFEQSLFAVTEGDTHILEQESCRPDVQPDTDPQECGIKLLNDSRYEAGSEYYLTSHTFHRVAANFCITLLQREPRTKELAEVVREKNAPKVCAFSKQIPEAELWEIVTNMLNQ